MSVLERKLFRGGVARLKHGGNPSIDHESGELISSMPQTEKNSTITNQLGGIQQGMQEFQPIARSFANKLFPEKSQETYEKEAMTLYPDNLRGQRDLIEQQKKEDIAASLINFGSRLVTGKGKALDIFGTAAQQTVPEISTMRRATRVQEAQLVQAQAQAKTQRTSYALTQSQKDAMARANVVSQAMFSNLGFFQEITKQNNANRLDLESKVQFVKNKDTGLNTEVTLDVLLADMAKPENERTYSREIDPQKPFVMFDKNIGENRAFATYEEYAALHNADPKRFLNEKVATQDKWKHVFDVFTGKNTFVRESNLDPNQHAPIDDINYLQVVNQKTGKLEFHPKNIPLDTDLYKPVQTEVNIVKKMLNGMYTHPVTGKNIRTQVKELKTGEFLVPNLDSEGRPIMQVNGHPEWIPLGTGINDLIVGAEVTTTAEDVYPAAKLDEQLSGILLYDRNIGSIDRVITTLLKDPTLAGFPGFVQDFKQRGYGMLADTLAADDEGALALLDEVKRQVERAIPDGQIKVSDASDQTVDINALFDPGNKASQQFWGKFKPELAQNRVRINAIAYAVARSRKSSGRLNLDDIQRAYESLKITGAIDSQTVIAGLLQVRAELQGANRDLQSLYRNNGGTFLEGESYKSNSTTPPFDASVVWDTKTNSIIEWKTPNE